MSGSGVFALGQDPLYITSIHTWGRAWKNGEVSEETAVNEKTVIAEPTFERIKFTKDCYLPVRFYLHWFDLDQTWKSDGPWALEPGQTGYVAKTQNRIYYFAALTTDNQFVWKGETPVNMNGDIFLMRKAEITTDTYGDWIQKLSCD